MKYVIKLNDEEFQTIEIPDGSVITGAEVLYRVPGQSDDQTPDMESAA